MPDYESYFSADRVLPFRITPRAIYGVSKNGILQKELQKVLRKVLQAPLLQKELQEILNMVFVKVSETYDLSTKIGKWGLSEFTLPTLTSSLVTMEASSRI